MHCPGSLTSPRQGIPVLRSRPGIGPFLFEEGCKMAAVVAARLIPWEPGIPGIAYELDDGTEGSIAGPYVWSMPEVKRKLSFVDRRNFEEQMRNAHADTGT